MSCLDKAEWQYESTIEFLCEETNCSENELKQQYKESIWEYASNHITMFVVWLAMNDLLSEMHYEDEREVQFINDLKCKNRSGFAFFEKYFDLTFSSEDIKSDVFSRLNNYYENDYLNDYCEIVDAFVTPFSWDDYDKVSAMISKATGIPSANSDK